MPRFKGKALIEVDKTVFASKIQIQNLWDAWILEGRRLGVQVLVPPEFEEVPE